MGYGNNCDCISDPNRFGRELFPSVIRHKIGIRVILGGNDDQLIQECLNGHTEAFGQLVLKYQERVYQSVARLLGNRTDASDVTQETFVQAYEKLSSFRGESAFYSWLFRIAWNNAMTWRRKRRPANSLESMRESTGVEPTDRNPLAAPEHPLEVTERQALVRRALESLTEEYRAVLVLKEMEDLSYEEIAGIVNCPVGTVRSRIHRGREELRQRLRRLLDASEYST